VKEKGAIEIEKDKGEPITAYKNSQYNKLAHLVRANLDMEKVYRIIER